MAHVLRSSFFLIGCLFVSCITFAEEKLTIGAMAELSGTISRSVGEDCRRGFELAKDLYSSPNIQLSIADNGGDPKRGLSEFQRLVNVEHVAAVVTTRSSVGLAINPISKQKEIPLIGIVGHPSFLSENPFAFRVFSSAEKEGAILAQTLMSENKNARVAVITLEDEWFVALSKSFEAHIPKNQIVFTESLSAGERDFSSLISRLKTHNPDVVFVNLAPGPIASVLQSLHEQGMNPQIASNFLFDSSEVLSTIGSLADGVTVVGMKFAKPIFLEKLKEKFGSDDSSPMTYACFMGVASVLQALTMESNKEQSPTQRIMGMQSVSLPDEVIAFKNHEAQVDVVVRKIKIKK